MKIDNIRLGHACNSSSQHYPIIYNRKPDYKKSPEEIEKTVKQSMQRDYFKLTEPVEKLNYIARLLSTKTANLPGYIWDYCVENWLDGVDVTTRGSSGLDDSLLIFPRYFNSDFINKEFFDDMKKYFMRDDLMVYATEDFSYDDLPPDAIVDQKFQKLSYYYYTVARKDKFNNFWVLYSPVNGHKLRFSFEDNVDMFASSAPELVDLKITNYCDRGCSYCYQSSSRSGEHASFARIRHAIMALSELEVFEIALGGGEPTLHPDFNRIIRACKEFGITPNFTTRNLDWFKNDDNVQLFSDCCGGAAISVNTLSDLRRVEGMYDFLGHSVSNQISIQCIDGVSYIRSILAESHRLPVTILGYKRRGRASDGASYLQPPLAPKELVELCPSRGFSIDTAYAKQYEAELDELGVDKRLYDTSEGGHSMYIDLVEGKVGPYSYCDDAYYKPLNMIGLAQDVAEHIQEIFNGFDKGCAINKEGADNSFNNLSILD